MILKLIASCLLFVCTFGCSQPLNFSTGPHGFLHAILEIGEHSNLADYQFSANQLGINFSPTAAVPMKNWYGANTDVSVINYQADGPSNRYPFIFFKEIEYSEHIDPSPEKEDGGAMLILHLACSDFAMGKPEVHSIFGKFYTKDTVSIKDSEKFIINNGGEKFSIIFSYSPQNSCIKQISIIENIQEE
ncbi:hypothetical protein [Paraburkholderia aromaticivorans]|uniref:hypothetical protein n=1 Tax=Paraburkholderia aromaticivorans TaxID=2026199 RepID=UPI0014560BEE|nr:hypothetical protein [Paraburkholderia aromaticivorans]